MSEYLNRKMEQIAKAQPTQSQVHVNAPLTNISVAYIQSQADFIADKVFPLVPVDKQSDIFWLYTKGDWFRDEAVQRAAATESAGGGYSVDSTNTYACKVFAFHKDVPDQVRSNADAALDMDRDATLFITQRLILRRERVWTETYMTTGIWGTTVTGTASSPTAGSTFVYWDDYANSDPITDIKVGRMKIKKNTGFRANTLVIGEEAYESLRNHPDIVDRYKYTSSQVVTADMIARLFEVDRLLIAGAVYNTTVEGATDSFDWVVGKSALLCYSAPNPGLMTPSAGYTFAWKGLSGMGYATAIKNFRMEHLEADRIEGQSAFDCKLVASDLGYYFNNVTA